MEENKVKIGEKYKCIASPRYTCFKIGDTYEIKDEFEAELISLCRDCFTLDEESEDEKVRRELTTFLINYNNGVCTRPSEDKIDSWIKWIDKKPIVTATTKFKVGDWVTDGNNVMKIKCLGNEFYCFESTNGYIDDILISELDSKYHIWTIKDAKNGDILTTINEKRPFIFKGLLDPFHPTQPVAHCGIASNNTFAFIPVDNWWTDEDVEPAPRNISDSLFKIIHENGYEWDAENKKLIEIRKQSEQKLTDKVEPKFKAGDWVRAISSGNIFKILSANDGLYRVLCYDGVEANYPIEDVDYDLEYWTIQDANDGDVLANKDGAIFINAGSSNGGGTFDCYCYLSIQNKFCIEEHKTGSWFYKDDTKPATKEQRDLLFQKMKEAGYEWDAEKKELKKIEILMSIDDAIEHCKEKSCCNNACALEHKQLEKWLTELKELKEQKPAEWCEDDEKMFNSIIEVLEVTPSARFIPIKREIMIPWLKSLKDRVQPQPKQELSEDDELMLNSFLHKLEVCDLVSNKEITWIKNKLKSIKNWKPSEKQMDELEYVTRGNSYPQLTSLYQDLKKL